MNTSYKIDNIYTIDNNRLLFRHGLGTVIIINNILINDEENYPLNDELYFLQSFLGINSQSMINEIIESSNRFIKKYIIQEGDKNA